VEQSALLCDRSVKGRRKSKRNMVDLRIPGCLVVGKNHLITVFSGKSDENRPEILIKSLQGQ
jgi:hypothetical protein